MANDVIKAEDVTNDIFEGMNSLLSDQYILKHQIAAILNAAIDVGLVSPPCWEVVGDDYKIAMVFKRKVSAERWIASDHGFRKAEVRHWKGRTE